jgi:vacuolar protein sorting-associated protein 52
MTSLAPSGNSNSSLPSASDLALPTTAPKESSSSITNNGASSSSSTTEPFSEEQLSNDLAAFLENPSLKAALADGSLDLASYSSTVEGELAELEAKCIEAYREKTQDIASLAKELETCDGILLGLQEMLLGFQADLGGLSGDIRQLQETSKTLGIQLHNRKAAALGLRDFLGRIILSPHLVNTIVKGPVNADFQQAIQELTQLYNDTHETAPQDWACGEPPSNTVAGKEMQAHIQQLRLVAVSRIREYFYQQMTLLRKPQTNIRILQSHGLLHYADLYEFLMDAAPDIAKELFKVYTDNMAKTLYALFRTYQAQLIQLDATKYAATRQDVLAVEDAYLRDAITTKAKKRVDVFTLGNRANVLNNTHENPIVAYVATSERQTFPYERLLKSCLQHLVDAVTNEYVVCRQFFKRDAFEQIFPPTLQLLLEQLENYLFGCYDALCILLMIKVTHQFRRSAQSRTIHCLDSFFDQMTHLLWPRLKTVMELHLRSIKQATPQSLGGVDLHAHYVSRRFAEFTCSVLLILQKGNKPAPAAVGSPNTTPRKGSMKEPPASATPPPSKRMANIANHAPATDGRAPPTKASAGDMLLQDLNELLDEYIALLERLSEEHTVNIKKIVFMINNLDQAVCIFQERRVAGGKELNRILELLMLQRELFVEEELLQGFSKMIAFVQQTEASLATGQATDATVNIQVVEALVREFASNWRSGMEAINRNVLSFFSNFRNGMEILKQVLTQLLLYYTRFQDVIRKVYKRQPPAFTKDLVPTTTILAEIKKYALAI